MTRDHPLQLAISRRALAFAGVGLVAGCGEKNPLVPIASFLPVPGLKLPSGLDLPPVDTSQFSGRVTLLNIWASWCPICRGEHDFLKTLSSDRRFTLAGLIYRDSNENARTYLSQAGNPYAALSVDTAGFVGRALGVRGVPYTFVVGRDRKVAAHVVGGLDATRYDRELGPAIAQAISAPSA